MIGATIIPIPYPTHGHYGPMGPTEALWLGIFLAPLALGATAIGWGMMIGSIRERDPVFACGGFLIVWMGLFMCAASVLLIAGKLR